MISQVKKEIYFGNTSAITGVTINEPANEDVNISDHQYKSVAFLLDVKTLGGSGPSAKFSIQELVSDNAGADVFVETAQATVTSTGRVWITVGATGRTGDVGSNPAMGLGATKRIVVTMNNALGITSANVDIYEIFYN